MWETLWKFLENADHFIETDIYIKSKALVFFVVFCVILGGFLTVNFHESSFFLKHPNLILGFFIILIACLIFIFYGLMLCS